VARPSTPRAPLLLRLQALAAAGSIAEPASGSRRTNIVSLPGAARVPLSRRGSQPG